MRDLDVRLALRSELEAVHRNELSTRIIEELGLCERTSRIDVAVVNGSLNGYEIKSERDTLERLPGQMAVYSRIFDTVTIVTSKSHAAKVAVLVPHWWGITLALAVEDTVQLEPAREPTTNPSVDPLALASLLWRDEALSALEIRGLAAGVRSKPRGEIWARLATCVPLTELNGLVRETLKSRQSWRVPPQQM